MVITCELKKNTDPAQPGTHFTTLWMSSCLPYLERHKQDINKNGKQTSVEELSFKSIVAPTIADSY